MSDYFLGEIRIFSMDWAPKGWALCNGATLPINQNAALFSLLGTQFGGNGTTTFQLPDLQGRAITGFNKNTGPIVGTKGGVETVTLTVATVPAHTHMVMAKNEAANQVAPAGNYLANPAVPASWPAAASAAEYLPAAAWTAGTQLAATTVTSFGGSQPHQNMQPSTVINYSISLTGLYPSRN